MVTGVCNFPWSLCECFYSVIIVIRVNNIKNIEVFVYALPAWGSTLTSS